MIGNPLGWLQRYGPGSNSGQPTGSNLLATAAQNGQPAPPMVNAPGQQPGMGSSFGGFPAGAFGMAPAASNQQPGSSFGGPPPGLQFGGLPPPGFQFGGGGQPQFGGGGRPGWVGGPGGFQNDMWGRNNPMGDPRGDGQGDPPWWVREYMRR